MDIIPCRLCFLLQIAKLREQNAIAKHVEIDNATKETKDLDLLISKDIIVLIKQKDLNKEIEPVITLDENLSAPIALGQKVGTITYNIEGIEYSADLLASHEVKKSSLLFYIIQIILIVFILFILYKLFYKKNNNKRKKLKSKNVNYYYKL